MNFETVLTIVREITVTGLLAVGIVALLRGLVVTRFHYDEMRRLYEERIVRLKNGVSSDGPKRQ